MLSGGENVFPEDVEAAYGASPLIREAAVFERKGRLAALFVPDDEALRARGATSARSLLRDAIEDISLGLPSHQRISGFRLSHAALPRTHLGKLKRHLLTRLYESAEGEGRPQAAPELSEADRRLLASAPAGDLWAWLAERFPGKPLTLDTSPQLDLEIDSLDWVALSLEIQERFGIELTGDAIAGIVTLRDLLAAANAAAAATGAVMPADIAEDARWLQPLGPLLTLLAVLVYALNRLVIRLLFRLRVEGIEHLPREGPYVVTPNHASYLDPLMVPAALPPRLLQQVHWAGWTGQMFTGPAWRLLSRIARVFPVDPDRAPARSLALGETVLGRGEILVWFPEGRRSRDGRLGSFLPGIGQVLQHSGARAVPARISGTYAALPRDRRFPRFGRVTITFAAPKSAEELERLGRGADRQSRLADGLRRAVAELEPGTSFPPL